jgi:hypothetical protein
MLALPLGVEAPEPDYASMVTAYDLGPAEVQRRLGVYRAAKLALDAGLPLVRTPDAAWDFEVRGPTSYARLKVWVEEGVYRAPSTWREAGLPEGCEALVIREGRMVRGTWRKPTDDGKIRRRLGEAVLRSYLRNASGDVVVVEQVGASQLAIPLPSIVAGGSVEWVFD